MSYADKLSDDLRMDINNWPHQFTKTDKEVQIGEIIDEDGNHYPKFAVPMYCVHCHAEYLNGKDARPPDPCPARGKEQVKKVLDGR